MSFEFHEKYLLDSTEFIGYDCQECNGKKSLLINYKHYSPSNNSLYTKGNYINCCFSDLCIAEQIYFSLQLS